MSPYPPYARPVKFLDIPANPGYRVRKHYRFGPIDNTWYNVIAWRLIQDEDSPQLGWPIVVSQRGIEIVSVNPLQRETLEFCFPDQEVPK